MMEEILAILAGLAGEDGMIPAQGLEERLRPAAERMEKELLEKKKRPGRESPWFSAAGRAASAGCGPARAKAAALWGRRSSGGWATGSGWSFLRRTRTSTAAYRARTGGNSGGQAGGSRFR